MNKKIKKALVKIANEIIDLDNKKSINEDDVFHKVGQLNEVLSVYRFLKKNNITNWEIQENQLNLILNEIIGISESEEDLINQNSKLEVEPLIEKIKDSKTKFFYKSIYIIIKLNCYTFVISRNNFSCYN